MASDKESIQQIIRDTVSLLCRNGLLYDIGVRIQGLIGITVDDSDVLLVHFDESYINEQHRKHHNIDSLSTTRPAMTEPLKSSPRKRPKLSKTAASVTSEKSAAGIVFVAADASDNDVRVGLDLFCSTIDNDIDYDDTHISSPVFKSEDSFVTTDVNFDINNMENQNGYEYEQHVSRSKSPEEKNYVDSVSREEATVQTTNLRRKLTTSRPHVKQDYWSQPARHIIRRYQQRQQQQQALYNTSDDSKVLTRPLQPYMCSYPDCERQFSEKRNLQRHETRRHSRTCTPRQLHTCGYPECGKHFTQKRNLQRHETRKHGRTPTYRYCVKRNLPKNLLMHHETQKRGCTPTQLSLQLHKCDYTDCGKQFSQKRNLRRHQRLKHDYTPIHVGLQEVSMKADDMNSEQSCNNTGVVL